MTKLIRIATRQSKLALWQANAVKQQILAQHPKVEVELVPMTTKGDQILDRNLQLVGGKGLFVKELEQALLDRRADIAVHSMKDVPTEFPEGLYLPVILERSDPRDVFVSKQYGSLEELPAQAVVGTSSLRRKNQILLLRDDLVIKDCRGNINTRVDKMLSGEYDAIILAAAGVERIGLTEHVKCSFSTDDIVPASGQAAMGIECREDDDSILELLSHCHHDETARCITAERAITAALGGSCHMPLGVYATVEDDLLVMQAILGDMQTGDCLEAGAYGEDDLVIEEIIIQLYEQGAEDILNQL